MEKEKYSSVVATTRDKYLVPHINAAFTVSSHSSFVLGSTSIREVVNDARNSVTVRTGNVPGCLSQAAKAKFNIICASACRPIAGRSPSTPAARCNVRRP